MLKKIAKSCTELGRRARPADLCLRKECEQITFVLLTGCLVPPPTELMDCALQSGTCKWALAMRMCMRMCFPENVIGC